jgi:hypothetical protein
MSTTLVSAVPVVLKKKEETSVKVYVCAHCNKSRARDMINDTSDKIHLWKKWDQRNPTLKTDPMPPFADPLRATLICMVLAHSRSKLHCRVVWGKDIARRVEFSSLQEQEKWVRAQLEAKRWKPLFSEEEKALLLMLLS